MGNSLTANEYAWLVVEHADGTRQHVRLTLALTTLGRSEHNVVEVLDPKLSRFHCEVERKGGAYLVRDCNSRNGTLVNGGPVKAPRPLSDGDRIKIGRTVITFCAARPDELRSDPAVALSQTRDELEDDSTDTPSMAQKRPTNGTLDARQTATLKALSGTDPWKLLAEASHTILGATSRSHLLELTLDVARQFFQARGALMALGRNPDALTITASVGLDDNQTKERCMSVAARVLALPDVHGGCVYEDRRALGLPIHGGQALQGALVLNDLSRNAHEDSAELKALRMLADVVGRTLTGSLLLEEVRREERAAGARRIASDLRTLLRPEPKTAIPGLQVGLVTAPSEDVGSDFWDQVQAPPRAGRQELYFALGDVPDKDAPPTRKFRRRGERAFVSLLGQAELRGALRLMVEVMPRTSDQLVKLNRALQLDGCVERLSLLLARFDPSQGALRFSGAGHEPVLVRRKDGRIESFDAIGGPLGVDGDLQVAERDLLLERDDQVLFVTAAAASCGEDLSALFARMGGVAHSVQLVAERIAEVLQLSTREGFTVLLLRRS